MAFLTVESSNPDFSFIIQKNPNNPEKAIAKEIRQGCALGWFPFDNQQKFCVRFTDPPQEMSYNKASYEYLDVTAFSSPSAYSNIIRDVFNSVLKVDNPLDTDNFPCVVTFGFIKCYRKFLEQFSKFFGENITYEEQAKYIYKIQFSTTTIKKSLHLANLFCVFMMLNDEDQYVDVKEDMVSKYIKSVQAIQCPYYIANLFKVQLLRSEKLFKTYASTLANACTESVKFQFGNTLEARKKWIENYLVLKNNIVDIGAGDTFNYGYLSKRIKGLYYPVDKDSSVRESIKRKVSNKRLDSVVEPVENWDSVKDLLEGNTEVLLTEILEHNTLEEAKELLLSVINHEHVKNVLVTLPLLSFNQYYLIEDGTFRHEDHQWELTNEIEQDFNSLLSGINGISYEWNLVGDIITTPNGEEVSPTKCLIINKD